MYKLNIIIVSAVIMAISAVDLAQRANAPATTPSGDNGDSNFQQGVQQETRVQNRQKVLKKIQADLGCSDVEFAVLQPFVEKCMATCVVATDLGSHQFFGVGRIYVTHAPGKDGSPLADPPPGKTPAWQALQDLDHMLHDPKTTVDQIKAQMQVVRQDRQQAQDDYEAACKQLRALVNRRQEVVLFLNDVLD